MTRALLMLIMLLFAAPSFAQTKQSALVANQQQLDSIAKAVQINIEKDLAIDKESRQSQCAQVDRWITLFGVVITVMGVILPVVMFFMGEESCE